MTALPAAAIAAVLGPLTILLAARLTTSPRRPTVVESVAVAAAVGLAVAWLGGGLRLTALPLALLGPVAAVIDAREGRLPDVLTGPMLGATLLLALMPGHDVPFLLATAISASAVAAVLAIVARELVGWGDTKLVPTLAVVLADHGALLGGLLRTTVLILVTAALALTQRRGVVPYGPALITGALAAAAAGA